MIGIVIVSHSARLAEGVTELARAAGPNARLATAGGLDLPGQPLGTDAALILRAIEEVYSDDGVLVLMDLGSALLSAEMALDLLDPDKRSKVALCAAPLVEGAVVAAVQAGLGNSLQQVISEALGALRPKSAHLNSDAAPIVGDRPDESSSFVGPPLGGSLRVGVRNPLGLHARPAARLVQTAALYEAEVSIRLLTSERGPVSARSINAVTTLGVRQGDEIELNASGPQASEALAALRALAEANFGEAESRAVDGPVAAPATTFLAPIQGRAEPLGPGATLRGLPGSPGLALGPARHVVLEKAIPEPTIAARAVVDIQAEWRSLIKAIAQARAEIETARQRLAYHQDTPPGKIDRSAEAADILSAHLLFLQDEALLAPAREGILSEGLDAAQAWQRAVDSVAQTYGTLDDPYLRGRAKDVIEVGRQVLAHLPGAKMPRRMPVERGILIADDLSAAEVARLDRARVQAICTAYGAPTAHSTILARSLGLPAVVGLGEAILSVAEDTALIVDGSTGEVVVDPSAEAREGHVQRAEAQRRVAAKVWESRQDPAITRDGRRVQVLANIGAVADAGAAMRAGAEGVGVLRTEFLFLDRATAPDEEEQCAAYRTIAAALEGHPLTIRTLDVGGDKPLPYLAQPPEANPFLGWRAIRLSLERPEILSTQLMAILRTAIDYPVQVLLPMIATLAEWRACQGHIARAVEQLRKRGLHPPLDVPVGIMVEVPSAALQADAFAAEVDFLSLGTNDLAQYALAAERGNPRVAVLSDALQPAVIRLVERVARAARARHKPVAVCGELASDPLAAPLLVGLGIDEFSMNAAAIPRVKQAIREIDTAAATRLARQVLRASTIEDVRTALIAYPTKSSRP